MARSRSDDGAPGGSSPDSILIGIERGSQVRRRLPPNGRIHIDRQLPFLVLYRPHKGRPEPLLRRLVSAEASYLIAPTDPSTEGFVQKLVQRVAETQAEVFGGYLIIRKVWRKLERSRRTNHTTVTPGISAPKSQRRWATMAKRRWHTTPPYGPSLGQPMCFFNDCSSTQIEIAGGWPR